VVSRNSAANATSSKPKGLYKITPMEPIELAGAINEASKNSHEIFGSQWAVLPESNTSQLMETPGQVDELLSDHATPTSQSWLSAKQSQDAQDPLFLPSETQQSFPYSQFPEIFASQRKNVEDEPSHESEDENEVLSSVVKPAKPQRTYPSLSQIASSQTFTAPKFQPADFGRFKEPESLYGRSRRDVSETESSSSGSDSEDKSSHIPASRRAGLY